MELNNQFLNEMLDRFEKEAFSNNREIEIAETLEFEILKKDQDNIYCLQFDQHDETYSISLVKFKPNNGEYLTENYLETYQLKSYDRDFLIERIRKYVD